MPSTPIADMPQALARRDFPTVTIWNRVEGRPRSTDFGRALKAEVRDALWMIARQWQLGEFRGEDAGSPVTATYHLSTARPVRFRPGDGPATDLPDTVPLEAVAQHRAVPFTIGADPIAFDLRLAMGRRWLAMLSAVLLPIGLRQAFINRYPIRLPDPETDADTPLVADPDVWAVMQAAAGRMMDGYELYLHLTRDNGHAYDGIPDILLPLQKATLDENAATFVAWFDGLISQPSGPDAWDPVRLEHGFSIAAPGPAEGKERVLTTREHPGGPLDWYAFSHDPGAPGLGATAAGASGAITRTVFPGATRFPGMPYARWWAVEDGRTNFCAVTPDTTDLVRLLFLEFALVFSNDWFLLPCDLPAGTLANIDGLAVTDVFGQRFWITPAGSGADEDWQRWAMYDLDIIGTDPVAADTSVFLPPVVPTTAQGPELEDILLIRDENANMVWGVETTVPLATGDPQRGAEAAAETLAHRLRLTPSTTPPEPVAAIAYKAMNTVPENWIPFIPVHVPGDTRQIQLQRAAIPRAVPGDDPPLVRPRTTLLRDGLDTAPVHSYFVHEEEVPRAGTRLALAYHRTRWHNGRAVVWLGAHRTTGRGEGSSGLAFDRLTDTSPS